MFLHKCTGISLAEGREEKASKILLAPGRIVMDIIEGLEILNQIIPGVNADSTLI